MTEAVIAWDKLNLLFHFLQCFLFLSGPTLVFVPLLYNSSALKLQVAVSFYFLLNTV